MEISEIHQARRRRRQYCWTGDASGDHLAHGAKYLRVNAAAAAAYHINYQIVSSQPWDRGIEPGSSPLQGRATTYQATAAPQRQRLIFLQFEGFIHPLNYREIDPIGARLRPLSHSDNSSAIFLFMQTLAERGRLSHKPQIPCCDSAAITSAPLGQLDGTQPTRDAAQAAITLASMPSAQPTPSLLPTCSTPGQLLAGCQRYRGPMVGASVGCRETASSATAYE